MFELNRKELEILRNPYDPDNVKFKKAILAVMDSIEELSKPVPKKKKKGK